MNQLTSSSNVPLDANKLYIVHRINADNLLGYASFFNNPHYSWIKEGLTSIAFGYELDLPNEQAKDLIFENIGIRIICLVTGINISNVNTQIFSEFDGERVEIYHDVRIEKSQSTGLLPDTLDCQQWIKDILDIQWGNKSVIIQDVISLLTALMNNLVTETRFVMAYWALEWLCTSIYDVKGQKMLDYVIDDPIANPIGINAKNDLKRFLTKAVIEFDQKYTSSNNVHERFAADIEKLSEKVKKFVLYPTLKERINSIECLLDHANTLLVPYIKQFKPLTQIIINKFGQLTPVSFRSLLVKDGEQKVNYNEYRNQLTHTGIIRDSEYPNYLNDMFNYPDRVTLIILLLFTVISPQEIDPEISKYSTKSLSSDDFKSLIPVYYKAFFEKALKYTISIEQINIKTNDIKEITLDLSFHDIADKNILTLRSEESSWDLIAGTHVYTTGTSKSSVDSRLISMKKISILIEDEEEREHVCDTFIIGSVNHLFKFRINRIYRKNWDKNL